MSVRAATSSPDVIAGVPRDEPTAFATVFAWVCMTFLLESMRGASIVPRVTQGIRRGERAIPSARGASNRLETWGPGRVGAGGASLTNALRAPQSPDSRRPARVFAPRGSNGSPVAVQVQV